MDDVDMEALVAFLPLFKSRGFSFGQWQSPEGQMPFLTYSKEAEAFLEALDEHGWIEPFDWSAWQGRAARYVREPKRVSRARLGTLRKLLTTHVRKERFCEGHLIAMFESGHLVAILERIRAILCRGRKS